jgi:hypothetical protein
MGATCLAWPWLAVQQQQQLLSLHLWRLALGPRLGIENVALEKVGKVGSQVDENPSVVHVSLRATKFSRFVMSRGL